LITERIYTHNGVNHGWPITSLYAIFDEWVVYRNLEPLDPRIAGLRASWREIGLDHYYIPRKAKDEDYVRVILHFAGHMQEARRQPTLQRLLYLGNRRVRDRHTIQHFMRHVSWPFVAFLCEEDLDEPGQMTEQDHVLLANRWAMVADLAAFLRDAAFPLDAQTAIVVDMDKTIIGARGRNDGPLNRARIEGVRLTVRDLLGERFDEPRFQAVYGEMNQPRYHFFTEDNQDYVTYASLMASALVYPINDLIEDLAFGKITSFAHFVAVTGERIARMSLPGLTQVHQELARNLAAGDPTVFKSFRSKQFESTVARILSQPADADESTILGEEITITREVHDLLMLAKSRGALLLLISDRPDESLLPGAELAQQGYRPIHYLPMRVVGQALGLADV